MDKDSWATLQDQLAKAGFYNPPLTDDGIPSTGTRLALAKFELARGLARSAWPVVNPRTFAFLGLKPPAAPAIYTPPWGHILDAKMGLREVEDKAALEAFLRSDGSTLGDPSVFPWCGDLAQTVMLDAGYGPVPGNPYLALNWAPWGRAAAAGYYVLVVYRRPGPKGNEGHVGFLIGISDDGMRHRVRGGNESNQIGDAWIAAERCAAMRLPADYTGPISPLPKLNAQAQPLSTNEA